MANNGIIDTIVDKQAIEQLRLLEKELSANSESIKKLINGTQALNTSLSKSSSMKEMISLLKQQKAVSEQAGSVELERANIFNKIEAVSIQLIQAKCNQMASLKQHIIDNTGALISNTTEQQLLIETLETFKNGLSSTKEAYSSLSDEIKTKDIFETIYKNIKQLSDGVDALIKVFEKPKEEVKEFVSSIKVNFDSMSEAVAGNSSVFQSTASEIEVTNEVIKKTGEASKKSATGVKTLSKALKVAAASTGILLAITAIIEVVNKIIDKLNSAKKAQKEFNNAVAEASKKSIASVNSLSYSWSQLGDNMEAKKKFIKDNEKAFKELNVSIKSVDDVENLLVKNKDNFIKAQIEKAKATAANAKAADLAKKALEIQLQLEDEGLGDRKKKKLLKEQEKINKQINKLYEKASESSMNATNILDDSGIKSVEPKKDNRAAQEAKKAQQEILKVKSETKQMEIQAEADAQQLIINDNSKSFEVRLQAVKDYNAQLELLTEEQRQQEINIAKENITNKELLKAELNKINTKYNLQSQANAQEAQRAEQELEAEQTQKKIQQDQERYQKGLEALEENTTKRQAKINEDYEAELKQLDEQLKNKEITQHEYEENKINLSAKYSAMAIQEEINLLEAFMNIFADNEDEKLAIEKKINALRLKEEKAFDDAQKAIEEKKAERKKKYDDDLKKSLDDLKKEGVAFAKQFINDRFTATIQGYDTEIAKINERKEAELAALNEKGMSEETYAEMKKEIEEKAAEETAALEEKKKKAQIKQAQFEKAWSASQVAINTATAIMRAYSDGGPFLGWGLAAAIAAIGAVQIATILSKPIPKYAYGTVDHKGGPAIVGDGGKRELVVEPGGKSWITDNKPTLVGNLPKHSIVIPDADASVIKNQVMTGAMNNINQQAVEMSFDKPFEKFSKKLLQGMKDNRSELSVQLNDRGQWTINNNKQTKTTRMSGSIEFTKKN